MIKNNIKLGSTVVFTKGDNKGLTGIVVKIEKGLVEVSVHKRCIVKAINNHEDFLISCITDELCNYTPTITKKEL